MFTKIAHCKQPRYLSKPRYKYKSLHSERPTSEVLTSVRKKIELGKEKFPGISAKMAYSSPKISEVGNHRIARV